MSNKVLFEPFIAYHVPYISDDNRQEILVNCRQALINLETRALMQMPNPNHFDDTLRPQKL